MSTPFNAPEPPTNSAPHIRPAETSPLLPAGKKWTALATTSLEWPLYIATVLAAGLAHPERPSVLCFGRNQFNRDLAILGERSTKYNWLELPTLVVDQVQRNWMPNELMQQKDYDLYRGEKYDVAWAKCAAFAEQVIAKLQKRLNLVAVMAANFDYWTEEGFRLACRKMGVPFLVLMREHIVFPRDREEAGQYYAKENYTLVPKVDGVAVAGEFTSKVLIDCGVLSPDQLWITGLPRLDPWITALKQKSDIATHKSIVLVTYADPDYGGVENFSEVLGIFVAAARRHKGSPFKFIIKCKNLEDLQDTERLLRTTYKASNITLTTEAISDIVAAACLVIGLNSLAMIESALSTATLLIPQWGDARGEKRNQIFWREDPKHRQIVHFVDSAAEMDARIDAAAAGAHEMPDMPARVSLVQDFMMFDPALDATTRIESFVDHYVAMRARSAPKAP